MEANFSLEPWLDSAQVIYYIHELTGVELTDQLLLRMFSPEHHVTYVDCRFASGLAYQQQMFVRRIKGAGYCELLQADEMNLCINGASGKPLLSLVGKAIVLGSAWGYSSASKTPSCKPNSWNWHRSAGVSAIGACTACCGALAYRSTTSGSIACTGLPV